MMRDYAVIAKEVDLYLPSLFYRLPRLSFGFEAMDSAVAERPHGLLLLWVIAKWKTWSVHC